MKKSYAALAIATVLALSGCASAEESPSATEAAVPETQVETPTPTETYITPADREEVEVTLTREGDATSVAWDDLLVLIEQQKKPVLIGLVATPGATLTIVGSSEFQGTEIDGSMEAHRDAADDLVLTPKLKADGSVDGAGGELGVDLSSDQATIYIDIRAFTE